MKQPFTLVSTVFNEARRLQDTIGNIERQRLLPDEIIITDAGSQDGTYEALCDWAKRSGLNIKITQKPGCNVAEGRNLAIENASFDLIASTDFGCTHYPEWLASIITPFFNDDTLEVVGGNYSVNGAEIKTLPAKAEFILQKGYQIPVDQHFTVTSRSIAYKKRVWEEIGGYPEWLTLAADDSTFWKLIKIKGYRYKLIPDQNVLWTRHSTLKGFIKENMRYGLGDGESRTNFRNFWSHAVETGCRYVFFSLPVAALVFQSWVPVVLMPLFLFGLRSYINAFRNWGRLKSEKYHFGVLLYAFYMIEKLRWAYLKGYLQGWLFKPQEQRQKAQSLNKELS